MYPSLHYAENQRSKAAIEENTLNFGLVLSGAVSLR
jgi:hypothetical protein